MDASAIFNQFKNLATSPDDNNAFNVVSLPSMCHKLGISAERYPKFFVKTSQEASAIPNITLELLSVQYSLPCKVVEDGADPKDDVFTIITLQSADESLQRYFVEIILIVLEKLPALPSRRELSFEVENIISIFTSMTETSRDKVQGLWTELLVIERSAHPEMLISAWHSSPDSKYDFTMGRDKIEVKSTSKENRIHRFALDQLNPSTNSNLLIASAIVRESGEGENGLSIHDLYNRICLRGTAVNVTLKLYTVMAKTIGKDLGKLDSEHFDYTTASDTLLFYDARNLPRLTKEQVPEFVTNVKFDSDLTHIPDVLSTGSDFDFSTSPLYKSLFNR